VPYKGVPPKRRADNFTVFHHQSSQKIFFLGGMQMYTGDNTGNLIYSFNLSTYEWKIENYSGSFYKSDLLTTSPFINNKFAMNCMQVSQDKFLLQGGKRLENTINTGLSSINQTTINFMEGLKPFFEEVECDDLIEFDIINMKFSNKQYSKIIDDVKFSNCCHIQVRDLIYIYNKGAFYCYDLMMNELSMLKPLLFSPKPSKDSSLLCYNGYLYILGKFNHYEDCLIFKTSLDNLIPKWNCSKEISYEMLLNNKDCSDIVFVLNSGDKNREIHLNKKVMYNFSLPLKNILINFSQNSNYFKFDDVSFIGLYNTIKFIYSNFNDNISSYEVQILQEMIDIIIRYRAESLLNIIVANINFTYENAVNFYELANKFKIKELKNRAYLYICENMKKGIFYKEKNFNESFAFKKILYEIFFCPHLVKIGVNSMGFDIKNETGAIISQDKLLEMRDYCLDGKIYFCLNCRKMVNP